MALKENKEITIVLFKHINKHANAKVRSSVRFCFYVFQDNAFIRDPIWIYLI